MYIQQSKIENRKLFAGNLYEIKILFYAKQTQFPKCQNKRKAIYNKELRKIQGQLIMKNKAKTNPIQSQFHPKQTQFKPNFTQNKPNSNPIQTQFQAKRTQYEPNFIQKNSPKKPQNIKPKISRIRHPLALPVKILANFSAVVIISSIIDLSGELTGCYLRTYS